MTLLPALVIAPPGALTSSRLARSPALELPTCARVPSRSGARLTRVGVAAPTSGVGETHEDRETRCLGRPLSGTEPPAVEGDVAVELPPALGGCEELRDLRRRGGGGGGVSEAAAAEAEGAAAAEASASAAAFAARARVSPAIAPASAAGARRIPMK